MTTLLIKIIDIFAVVFVFPAAYLLKQVRHLGVEKLPLCKSALLKVGVFPIRDHYYEPRFNYTDNDLGDIDHRSLPGINWNTEKQLTLLTRFIRSDEFNDTVLKSTHLGKNFHFSNDFFEAGDAEYWYQLIRCVKPSKIIEIGSGYSTIIADCAIKENTADMESSSCEHICIEPYEVEWLENVGVTVKRERVETIDVSFFSTLQENDILFIDSSHVIRPGGDVLFEYLELLPTLKKGVIVHVHDIFSPRDYPASWMKDSVRFWNEQYLLEAFLSENNSWEIIGALNYLHNNHYEKLKGVAPFLTKEHMPGSFYFQKKI